jgi:hypothetical protein
MIKFKNINGIDTPKKAIFWDRHILKHGFFKATWDRYLSIQDIISHFIKNSITSLFAGKLSLHNHT